MEQSSDQLPGNFWGGREEEEKAKPKLRSSYNWKHIETNEKFVCFQNVYKILIWCTNPNSESSQAIPKWSWFFHPHLIYN